MRREFLRPGPMTPAFANGLQPCARELVPALREIPAAEQGRSRTGQRP